VVRYAAVGAPVRVIAMLLGVGLAAGGCGGDDVTPGVLGECASFSGAGLECESPPIETIADVCFKLLDCGVMPLDNANGGFDWDECMDREDDLDDRNREIIFACVEVSSCDELQRIDGGLPLCLQHGNL
jgi:hypothetical protein